MVLLRREAQLQGVNSVKVWLCNSGCYDPNFYAQGGATVNGTYAWLVDLPYLSDYTVNPALNKLVTELGGVKNLDNNGVNSFVTALLFQDAVEKATANGGTLDRQTLFTALNNDEHVVRRRRHHRPGQHRGPRFVRLLGARAAAERGVDAGGPDQARHLRLQPRQPRHHQDEHRLVATAARRASAVTAERARLPAPRPYRPQPRSSQ